jgi:hypothetical protein
MAYYPPGIYSTDVTSSPSADAAAFVTSASGGHHSLSEDPLNVTGHCRKLSRAAMLAAALRCRLAWLGQSGNPTLLDRNSQN